MALVVPDNVVSANGVITDDNHHDGQKPHAENKKKETGLLGRLRIFTTLKVG